MPFTFAVFSFVFIFLLSPLGRAAQAQAAIEFDTPITGSIAAPGAAETYTFSGAEGSVVSILVVGAGDFDPVVSLSSSAGRALIRNDDYAYPGRRDALLQAVTLPRTDTYTITISAVGSSTGDYTLTVFHGYAEPALQETFGANAESWQTASSQITVDRAAERITLSAEGISRSGYVTDPAQLTPEDFYARVRVVNVSGRNGWYAGLVLRRVANRYYQLVFNHNGAWRLTYHNVGDVRVVRDWTTHPAIRAGKTSFTVGVLAHGAAFDVFYDDFYVGQTLDDAYAPADEVGYEIGMHIGTPEAANSTAAVEYDDLLVTIPLQLADADILPDHLMAGGLAIIVQELERRRVIPAGGEQALNVPQSSGTLASAGVQRVILASGTTYNTMVMGTSFTVTAGQGTVGCGLLFGHTDETHYILAFLDKMGGHGLSPRVDATFQPGLFGESSDPAWREGRQELIVVRLTDKTHLYVNRRYVGTLPIPATEGEVGNAVVNYDPLNTTCQFTDTWVWRWE